MSSSGDGGRQCSRSGLWLVPERGEQTFRVGKRKYGALSAPERQDGSTGAGRAQWSRYDSLGKTLYVAADLETAFAEVLSPFKRQLGIIDPLEVDAAALGLTRNDLLEILSVEWSEADFMGVGAVPQQWRADRAIFRISGVGDAAYIDVEHPDSIAAIERELGDVLAGEGITSLTTAILRGENRLVTTSIARHLRHIKVEDGRHVRGIQFGSKFGGAWCRAIWMPENDAVACGVTADAEDRVLVSDEALARACERLRIRAF